MPTRKSEQSVINYFFENGHAEAASCSLLAMRTKREGRSGNEVSRLERQQTADGSPGVPKMFSTKTPHTSRELKIILNIPCHEYLPMFFLHFKSDLQVIIIVRTKVHLAQFLSINNEVFLL